MEKRPNVCLVLIAKNVHPRYPLVVLANRDEFFQRPTQRMHWWGTSPDILAGRDGLKGGAWFGVNDQEQLALVTNYREPRMQTESTRGELVSDFLLNRRSDTRQWLVDNSERYAGFNLIFGDLDTVTHFCNRTGVFTSIDQGYHGLSNATLDTPWPKVEKGKLLLKQALTHPKVEVQDLFDILKDSHRPPDHSLPQTSIDQNRERALSSIFVEPTQGYGSRSGTVLIASADGGTRLWERDYTTGRSFSFSLGS
jgi:uncharacterized protein with NRDE domain